MHQNQLFHLKKYVMAKKSMSVQMEQDQLNLLDEIMQATGIDNIQVHIRLAMRKYIGVDHEKIDGLTLQKIRNAKSRNHFVTAK